MRPPGFWFTPPQQPALRARLLSPLGWAYGTLMARHVARAEGWRAPLPVICVDSLMMGGSGRTPAVQALVGHLQSRGCTPVILTRGRRGKLRGPVAVDPHNHTVRDVGDETLLSAAFAPTWLARDRASGARAIAEGAEAGMPRADCIVMDDGFQDRFLVRDLSIIVVDAVTAFGNGRCIPAGPLREPLASGLARADLLMSIGPPAAQDAFRMAMGDAVATPTIRARMEVLQTGMDWRDARVLAFAGIGHPKRFFATLRGLGANLLRAEALEDHQPLTVSLMTRLLKDAQGMGAQLVTTEKDAVRLPADFRRQVLALPVRLRIDDPATLDAALDRLGL